MTIHFDAATPADLRIGSHSVPAFLSRQLQIGRDFLFPNAFVLSVHGVALRGPEQGLPVTTRRRSAVGLLCRPEFARLCRVASTPSSHTSSALPRSGRRTGRRGPGWRL